MISFANDEGSVKIRLACSRVLLLINSFSSIVTQSNGYIKGGKYFFFIKVGATNVLLKLNYLKSGQNTEKPYLSHQAISNIL